MKKINNNSKFSTVLKIIIIVLLLLNIILGSIFAIGYFQDDGKPIEEYEFNLEDVKVTYMYYGFSEDYLPTDKYATVEYRIKVENKGLCTLYDIKNIPMTSNNSKKGIGVFSDYKDVAPKSTEYSFPLKCYYKQGMTEKEIYNDIKEKYDIVLFSIEGEQLYSATGDWQDCTGESYPYNE